jgi:hypothetical protein
MKVIAHRANLDGPNPQTENTVKAIKECLDFGYDVEIDAQAMDGHNVLIGHDEKTERLNLLEFPKHSENLWFHAKNIEVAMDLITKKLLYSYRYDIFMHDKDECVFTHNNFMWQYPTHKTMKGRNVLVSVMPEWNFKGPTDFFELFDYYAVCTDHPKIFQRPITIMDEILKYINSYDTMYGSLYLSKTKKGTYELLERIYASYDRPDWNVKYREITEDQKDLILSTHKVILRN